VAGPAGKVKNAFEPIAPEEAIAAGQVNIKHDIMKALQVPVFALRILYGVQATETTSVLQELGDRGLLDPAFGAKLIETYQAASAMRLRNHLAAGRSEDKLIEVTAADRRALLRMVPLLYRLRQELARLTPADPNRFTLATPR
jgi:hypothetical protein